MDSIGEMTRPSDLIERLEMAWYDCTAKSLSVTSRQAGQLCTWIEDMEDEALDARKLLAFATDVQLPDLHCSTEELWDFYEAVEAAIDKMRAARSGRKKKKKGNAT